MIKLKDILTEGNKFDNVFKDYGFDVEKKSGGLTYWAHYGSDISGHKNSYIRGELSGWTDGKKSAVGDDRGRQSFSNPKAMAKWFEKNFKMKKESVNEASLAKVKEVAMPLGSYLDHALADVEHLIDVVKSEHAEDAYRSPKKSGKLLAAAFKLLKKVK